MNYDTKTKWNETFIDPSANRQQKPRTTGLTMMIDKGLGLANFMDILETSASHVDYIKLGFGTSVLYPQHILKEKIQLAHNHQISIYPGGTFFEIAFMQGRVEAYLNNLLEWGFNTLEISDGTIYLSRTERNKVIQLAKDLNFFVITECGKKTNGSSLELEIIKETLYTDLDYGADYMILEGRESGKNVGIYDQYGQIDQFFLEQIKTELYHLLDHIMWEAPQKEQQIALINSLGADINLGNIAVDELYSLESLRRGLRSDTFYLGQKV